MADTKQPVSLRDVSFSYRGTQVLKGLNLDVNEGEICALVGDNGAGKSTIARLAMGELSPDEGRVRLFGEDPTYFHDWSLVGYVPQLPSEAVSRFPATVLELVSASLYQGSRGLSRKELRRRALDALASVEMEGYAKRLIRELSGGQLQRVRLACALVGGPRLLVLDEPTNGLDAESREGLYGLVAEAHAERGIAVLLVTHDYTPLHTMPCRVMEIADGVARDVTRPRAGEKGQDGPEVTPTVGQEAPEVTAQAAAVEPMADADTNEEEKEEA